MSFKFYCPEKFQKNWLSGLFKNSEKPCLGSRLFGFKTMKVNNSESGLQYFIQKMAQYIIFELNSLPYKDHIAVAICGTIDLKTISFKSEMARGMEVVSISKY